MKGRTTDLPSLACRKEVKQLMRELQGRGGWSGRLASNHIRLYHDNGGALTIPSTPRGGNRSIENTRADIRRVEKGVTR